MAKTKEIKIEEAAQLLGMQLMELQYVLIELGYEDAETLTAIPETLFQAIQAERQPGKLQLSEEPALPKIPNQESVAEVSSLRLHIRETLEAVGLQRGQKSGLNRALAEITASEAEECRILAQYLDYKVSEAERELAQPLDINQALTEVGLTPVSTQMNGLSDGLERRLAALTQKAKTDRDTLLQTYPWGTTA